MTLHLWSHWFWITNLVFALLTLNVIADKINDASQEDVSHHLENVDSLNTKLGSKNYEVSSVSPSTGTTVSPSIHKFKNSSSNFIASVDGTISQADARKPKSIFHSNMRFAVTDPTELLPTHPIKVGSEPTSTEVIVTDSNDSYLIDETSNISTSTHIVPDRNTVAYSVGLSNAMEPSQSAPYPSSTDPSTTSSGQLITISKININKVHKNKMPDEKIFKKNTTNFINGITLKKILASNKTKQQVLANSSSVALNTSHLSTSEFKEVDHTAYQNDSPASTAEQNKTVGQQNITIKAVQISNIITVKNETDEDTFLSSSEISFNSSAENASFSTLNERIVAPDEPAYSSFNVIVIVVISATVVALTGLIGAVSFVMYRRYRWNKPQTLSDKCSNADSSGYIDDSTLRENSEEMYSLDNDSFLNSLEAMTIQNYWTDVKHTKL